MARGNKKLSHAKLNYVSMMCSYRDKSIKKNEGDHVLVPLVTMRENGTNVLFPLQSVNNLGSDNLNT